MSSWSSARIRLSFHTSEGRVAVLLGVAVLVVAAATVSQHPVGVFVDDGYYVILGKSLATGHGLRYLQLPGEPYGTRFPPGYPILLAALWKLAPQFPQNVVLFKLANAALLGVAASLGYLFGVRRLGLRRPVAIPAVLLGAASIPALVLAGLVLSETLFLTVLVASLLAAQDALEWPTLRRALIAGLLCGILVLVRTIGAVVLPILAFLLWRRRGWRHASVALAAGALLAGLWQVWVAAHPFDQAPDLAGSFGGYGGWIAQGFRDLGWSALWILPAHNAGLLAANLRVQVAPLVPIDVKDALLAVALLVCALGAWAAAKRATAYVWALAGYFGVVLMWPFAPLRYVWSVWLLVVLLFAGGVSAIARWRPTGSVGAAARWVAVVACGLVVTGNLLYTIRGYRGRWWNSIPREVSARATPLLQWAARHTTPRDVLVSDYDAMQHLYVGRRAVPAYAFTAAEYLKPRPAGAAARELGRIVAYYHARYVITSDEYVVRAAGVLNTLGGVRLVLADSTPPRNLMFRVEPPSASRTSSPPGRR